MKYIITEEMEGERVDKCIPLLAENLTRSYIAKLIKDGKVFVNGKQVKPSFSVSVGDEIDFDIPESIIPDILPENIPLEVLYEDNDVIIVNKPKNMVVHPAAGHTSGTLVNALMYHCKDNLSGINGVMRPGIVHRIDMNTTGSIIACKNDLAHNDLALQLKEHSINRIYHAIVLGVIKEDEGTINKPLGRNPQDRKKMAIVPDGKPAITHFKVLKRYAKYTYIECKLETGRTHQIRVHMASIGHPLLGDDIYTNAKWPYNLNGQCLHAKTLGFVHPSTKEYIQVDAPLPDYFLHLLDIMQEQ